MRYTHQNIEGSGIKTAIFRTTVICLVFMFAMFPFWANAETVTVKFRGAVDLAPFECEAITRSSFIRRLCYDKREEYVIVKLNDTYYHYCEVPHELVDGWRQAESMGRYYNANIKGRFDCRVNRVPSPQRRDD